MNILDHFRKVNADLKATFHKSCRNAKVRKACNRALAGPLAFGSQAGLFPHFQAISSRNDLPRSQEMTLMCRPPQESQLAAKR